MPVSKKRKKKRSGPSGPPLSKAEIAAKQNKLSRRQILIYVFSALIILSLAIGYIVGSSPQPVPQDASGADPGMIISTPASEDQSVTEESDTEESNTQGADSEEEDSTSEATSEPGQ